MKVYITSGTFTYLLNMVKEHPAEQLLLLHNNQSTLLLQETDRSTLFKVPRKYDSIVQSGQLKQEGFVVLYHVPVNSESQPVFEHEYKKNLKKIEGQSGLIAYRFLKPLGSDSYIILTQWQEESAFKAWQSSASYISVNDLKLPQASAQKMFTGDPFLSKYSAPTIDE
ncbi:antibiotic biosynthesis monooxygenase [Bacillus sp. AGMB 02131]|uniref:Antibiotic biosynthesis monooxygenase n=1 Tax=Peribacillus faecalis TaxID=2772559 RepID=A0A927CYY8_9BACI|nr:antibiotic biosynthesis monooxygenase [Peribacillus faecalis]MBD3110266.1 antibiotic biosynthesis monooxygenase [Peribacillus faecalis]